MLQSANTEIPLVQAGFFKPIMDTLDCAGARTASLLRGASLHRFDLSNSENYVPVELMYRLFEEIDRREGIDDFIEIFGHQIHAQGMCDWLDTIVYSPDLLSGINFAIEFEYVVLTHQRMRLEISGPTCKFSMLYLDQPNYLNQPVGDVNLPITPIFVWRITISVWRAGRNGSHSKYTCKVLWHPI
jgi:hypothetical protein